MLANEKRKKKKLCKSQIQGNTLGMLKRHSDIQDPQRARPQRTCQSMYNFP